MKCKLIMLVALVLSTVQAKADLGASVMLRHNGQTKFYQWDQVQNAVDDAVDGDTIYLTEGNYAPFNIDKRIMVRGAGPATVVEGRCIINIQNDQKLVMPVLDAISFTENVHVSRAGRQLTFRKVKMTNLTFWDNGDSNIEDMKLDRCDITSMTFPSQCISDFSKHYPNISIDLCRLSTDDLSHSISGGEYDFCFMPRDMLPENTEIDSVLTHTEPLVVIASKDGKFGKRDSISFSELADEKLLLLSESIVPIIYMEIMDLLRTFHISPTIESTYNDLISLYIGVNAGVGVTIIPKSLAEYLTNEHTKTILIEDTDTGVPYVMAWSKSISNPVARLFLNVANNFAKGDEDIFGL